MKVYNYIFRITYLKEIYRRHVVVDRNNNREDEDSLYSSTVQQPTKTTFTTNSKDTDEYIDDTTVSTAKPTLSPHQDRSTQIERQLQLREFCKKRKVLPKTVASSKKLRDFHFLYSDRASTIYCYVPKVACTNWKRVFQVFDGRAKDPLATGHKEKVHFLKYNTFDKLSLQEIAWRQVVYYSFLFVRHPFERVLSAFRNKLQDPYTTHYQRKYGARVLRMFRPNLTETEYKAGKNVTFPEFVKYIIKTHKKYGYSGLNEHWNSMQDLCHPCSMKYDFIGKMDSLIQDSQTVLQEIGWDKRVKFPVKAKDKYKRDLSTLVKQYYAQVPRYLIKDLYAIYKDDFEAFGFSTDGYL